MFFFFFFQDEGTGININELPYSARTRHVTFQTILRVLLRDKRNLKFTNKNIVEKVKT